MLYFDKFINKSKTILYRLYYSAEFEKSSISMFLWLFMFNFFNFDVFVVVYVYFFQFQCFVVVYVYKQLNNFLLNNFFRTLLQWFVIE